MQALIISNVMLWLLLITASLVLLGLIRQIGVLHARVAPAGALMIDKGVEVGQPAPQVTAADRAGLPVNIGYASEKSTLLFFLSPSCPICKSLIPAIKAIGKSTDKLEVIYVGDGDAAEHEKLIAKAGIEKSRYILSPEVGMTFQIGKLPYAVLIDQAGTLKAKGLVNSREHLDSLFETEFLGSSTLQEYLQTQTESPGIHTPS
jgi:methylamine dehydrogenase accessory protein MauD